MGCVAQKKALILCGDYMEDYEVMVPFYVLQAFGVQIDTISPGKRSGERCITAIHEFLGLELYTELVGHSFTLNANFEDVDLQSYDLLIVPGGRFTDLLSADDKCVNIVKKFAESDKLIFTSCHSQIMLVAAELLNGKNCTAFVSMKPVVELAGGIWWEQEGVTNLMEINQCTKDGNSITTIGWPTLAHSLKVLLHSLGAQISSSPEKVSVLFLCGDFVEDYEIYVPFKALEALGCKVDAVTPNKKKGEFCVTAVYDDEGGQVRSERRGHNFYITANWDDIRVDDYDCVVIPGGRSPELLIMNGKAIGLVKSFAEKDKVIGAVGQGKWLLAAAGLLKGKRCASGSGMKVIVKVGGGEPDEKAGCITDGKLVTAAEWSHLPAFVSQLSKLVNFSVAF